MNALKTISEYGVLPVLGLKDPNTAVQTATALRDGGLPLLEVIMRDPLAMDCLRAIKMAYPDMLVGAGTITNIDAVRASVSAGADFVVSPGFDRAMVEYCVENAVPVVPGCVTPSEVQAAQELGLSVVKFYPANRFGGVAGVEDLAGPFGKMKFLPTCGVNFDNLGDYLSSPAVAAVGGSFMARSDIIACCDWETITANCRKCVELSLGFELAHVGLNCIDRDSAVAVAEELNQRFPLGVRVGGKSTFVGDAVELMHIPYYGTHGHIGFKVNSPARAKYYFERLGIAVNEESISYDAKGEIKFFYLKDEVGGFALHVIKK